MLRVNGSDQWIDDAQVAEMRPMLDQFWNQSISWTSKEGGWTKLSFVGTDIWAYGIAGPEYGSMRINLGFEDFEIQSQTQDVVDYHKLLFEAHGLEDKAHSLTFTNFGFEDHDSQGQAKEVKDQKGRLGFDYAVIQSESFWSSSESSTSPSSSETETELQSTTQKKDQPISSSPSTLSSRTSDTATLAAQAEADANANAASSVAVDSASVSASASASASAAAAMAALLPTQYNASQLASLKEQYTFKWNPAAYFVVVFASLVVLLFVLFGFHLLVKGWANHKTGGAFRRSRRLQDQDQDQDQDQERSQHRHQRQEIAMEQIRGNDVQIQMMAFPSSSSNMSPGSSSQVLGSGERRDKKRPVTRVLQALNSRKIGLPLERQRAEAQQTQRQTEEGHRGSAASSSDSWT
ncbi:hypothetical protein IAT40_003921 [Kwoniella sp. CBS 6097]